MIDAFIQHSQARMCEADSDCDEFIKVQIMGAKFHITVCQYHAEVLLDELASVLHRESTE